MSANSSIQKEKRKAISRKLREIMTPEGVPIAVELAGRGDRASAVLIDLGIMFCCMIVTVIAISITFGFSDLGRLGLILILLAAFFFRNFYFMFFELKWQGQTPGKRRMGLKVIDRHGRPLSSEAIFARNMMREIELFLPMGILMSGSGSGITALMQFFAFVWAMTLVCLPMMNKDNLRAGDLVAGTLVVREPKIILAADMVEKGSRTLDAEVPEFVFTQKQLDAYGVFELQTLEALLRNATPEGKDKRRIAGQAIIKKIDWQDPIPAQKMDTFLTAYYQTLRKRLESQLLMGKRKEDKFDRAN
jgi:uncharacterized RDD family membrane protein YckC